MKTDKSKIIRNIDQYICTFCTVIICFAMYHWLPDDGNASFAITLGTVAYLFLCFYSAIFKNEHHGIFIRVVSATIIIVFANDLYDYNKLMTIIPILKNVDKTIFSIMMIVIALIIFVIIKIMMFLYENNEDIVDNAIASKSIHTSSSCNGSEENKQTDLRKTLVRVSDKGSWMVLYFTALIILIGAGCVLLSLLYNKGIFGKNFDFFNMVSFLLNYAGSIIMLLLAIVIVVIFMIEMMRLIISRMKAFSNTLKKDGKSDEAPLYALSAIIDIIICYFTYTFADFTTDSFYNLINEGKYLAFPLTILFLGSAFVILIRLTHAILVLLLRNDGIAIKNFLKSVGERAEITEQIIEIVQKIISIVLKSIITAVMFVSFIPDFFGTVYSFVLENTEDFELEEEKEDEDTSETENNNDFESKKEDEQ